MKPLSRNRFLIGIFILASIFIFFFAANQIPLMSGDEGRYAEVAREMWETKDFITPQFNYTHILEKPILAHFLTAISFALFGVNFLSARLPSILSGITLVGMTYFFSKRFFGWKSAILSAFLLTTSAGYVLMARMAMIDMLLTLFISAALFCFMSVGFTGEKKFYYPAYIAMGLALVTKGLIGVVLPLLAYTIYLAFTKNLLELRHMYLGRGLAIIALIFVPWGIAISIREPEFSYVFITEQHFSRFATGSFGRTKPFWFYFPILIVTFFPWSLLLPVSVRHGLNQKIIQEKNKILFLLIWAATIFIFFSIPKSKLFHYILPLSAPVAILIGIFLESVIGGKPMGWFSWPGSPKLKIGIAGAVTYLLNVCLILAMWFLSPYLSTYEYARYLEPLLKKDDIVAIYSSPDHFSDFPFYLKRRVLVAGSDRGTLARESLEDESEGMGTDTQKWFLESGPFIQLFNSRQPRVYCLLDTKTLDELIHIGLVHYRVLKEDHGKLLISNDLEVRY